MKFSYDWLKELAKFKESPEKLAEFLTLKAFEVESVEKKKDDWVLDVKLIPNRVADASGHVGLAREIATLKELGIKKLEPRIAESKTRKASDVLKVKIEKPADCARYTARVITGITVGTSPRWMKERLEACGIQSINNIVDASNYVLLELGQPTHVFDFDKLGKETGSKQKAIRKTIVVRRARKSEKLLALDDKTYELSPEILVIADGSRANGEALAIAGIKGGKHSGVSANTKTIVLESANFDPVRTRIASQELNLKTDASYRFERTMDPNGTVPATDRLAELTVGIAGGEILAGRVDVYPKPLRPTKILLRSAYAGNLIGENLPEKFYESCFKRLGWKYVKHGSDYVVEVPTQRRDIEIEEDIIEEIVRLLGYDKIRVKTPTSTIAPAEPNEMHAWQNRVRDILVGAGMSEMYAYAFTGDELISTFDTTSRDLIEIQNPASQETRFLAARPLYRYIKFASENLRRESDIRLFGIMKGFRHHPKSSERTPAEEQAYLILVKAKKEGKSEDAFYELKGVIERLLDSLGIAEHWYDDALTTGERKQTQALHPYRAAKVMTDSESLGLIGEVHPAVLERLKTKARIVFAELDFEKLWKRARSEAEYQPVGRFPAIIRDIAVIVPKNTKTESVTNIIETVGGALLIDSDLFDYFQDEAMEGRGQKSLAFHLIFQSSERTLTDEEANRIYKKIVGALKQNGWDVRE